ncbi:MAG TPA: hypothetical protein VFI06_03865 [Chitinophagaceae bacterium]|nr:hypothetical protein [Chitinophagaceae bacterium]
MSRIKTPNILLPLSFIFSFVVKINAQNVGIGTINPMARFHVADSSVLFASPGEAEFISPGNPPLSGAGRRMMWYVDKGAFRAGYVDGTQWNKNSIGYYSFATGYNNMANGGFSTAMGGGSTANGAYSLAAGYSSSASGFGAAAFGFRSSAKAYGSVSLGALNDDTDNPDPFNAVPLDRIFQVGNGDINLLTRNNAFTILRNGNVGIGHLNPIAPLSFSSSVGEKITFYGDSSPDYGIGVQSYLLQIHTDASAADIAFGYGSSALFTETMRIKGNGNVGIGTSTPSYPLSFPNTTGDKISLWGNSGAHYGLGVQGGLLQIHSANSVDDIAFGYGSSGSFTERMRVKGNGNIGIGNSNPSYLLDVNGRLRVRSGGSNSVSAGLWLNNNLNNEAAFMGMEDDTHIGFFGNSGAAWKLTMNTVTGALRVNGSEGSSGQLLRSNGTTQSASWVNPLNALYNNMTEYEQTAGSLTVNPLSSQEIPGMSNLTLVITSRSKVIVDAAAQITSNTCVACGGSTASMTVQVYLSSGGPLNTANTRGNIDPGETKTFVTGTKIITLNPGTYTIDVPVSNSNLSGPTLSVAFSRLNIIVIQE